MQPDEGTTQAEAGAVMHASVVDLSPDPQAWDEFVAGSEHGSHLQMTAWAEVKAANHWRSVRFMGSGVALREGAEPAAAFGAQLLLRRPPVFPWTFAYAPGGPVCGRWDAATVEAVTDGLRQAAAATPLTISHVRIEPEVELNGPEDRDGALRSDLRKLGWRPASRAQPPAVRRIDLTAGEESLWSGVGDVSRREIDRARAAGIRVVEGDGERIRDFHSIYREAMTAAGLPVRTEQSCRRIWNAFRPRSMARLLFAETPDGTPQATLFLLAGPSRVFEAYGGMTVAASTIGSGHLLRWEALASSQRDGARTYEVPQLAEPASAGLDSGFGGREVVFVGAWDLILDTFGRFSTEAAIRTRDFYVRHFSRSRHGRRTQELD